MDERTLTDRIADLVAEEQRIQEMPVGDRPKERLSEIEVTLDQLWDLLRQRRSREEFGLDPEDAEVRDPNVVERYIQ